MLHMALACAKKPPQPYHDKQSVAEHGHGHVHAKGRQRLLRAVLAWVLLKGYTHHWDDHSPSWLELVHKLLVDLLASSKACVVATGVMPFWQSKTHDAASGLQRLFELTGMHSAPNLLAFTH